MSFIVEGLGFRVLGLSFTVEGLGLGMHLLCVQLPIKRKIEYVHV